MRVTTKCKDCIFAEFDDENFQTGCSLGKIQQFAEKNVELLQTEEDGKTFYTISGKFCHYCRNKDWERIYEERVSKDFDRLKTIRAEMKFTYNAIIISNDNIHDILKTYGNLLGQSIKPKHITVMKYEDDAVKSTSLIKNFRKNAFNAWKIESLHVPREMADYPYDAQLIFNMHKYPYTLVIEAGKTLPSNVFHKIDDQIANEMFMFGVLKNDDAVVVARSIMDYLRVFYDGVEPKLKENKCQHLISTL